MATASSILGDEVPADAAARIEPRCGWCAYRRESSKGRGIDGDAPPAKKAASSDGVNPSPARRAPTVETGARRLGEESDKMREGD